MVSAGSLNPAGQASRTLALNMKLLAQHELDGFGGIGEGCNMQLTKDGVDTILDDRDARPGSKFADADLVGFPIRINIGDGSP